MSTTTTTTSVATSAFLSSVSVAPQRTTAPAQHSRSNSASYQHQHQHQHRHKQSPCCAVVASEQWLSSHAGLFRNRVRAGDIPGAAHALLHAPLLTVPRAHTCAACARAVRAALLEGRDREGDTPLHCAVKARLPVMCVWLLAQGADPAAEAGADHRLPALARAAALPCEHVAVTRALLQAPGGAAVAAMGAGRSRRTGATPLHVAAAGGREGQLRAMLLAVKADTAGAPSNA